VSFEGKAKAPNGEKRRRGRPNDSSIDAALLQAACDEFVEKGYHGMSMGAIAERAGVSKVSLYRRWKKKADIAANVFGKLNERDRRIEAETLEAYVQNFMRNSIDASDARRFGRLVMRTIGEIAEDPELLAAYRDHLLMPGFEQLRGVVERARQRGEIVENASTDAVCALIAGPLFLYYLALLAKADMELTDDVARQVSRLIIDGIRPRK